MMLSIASSFPVPPTAGALPGSSVASRLAAHTAAAKRRGHAGRPEDGPASLKQGSSAADATAQLSNDSLKPGAAKAELLPGAAAKALPGPSSRKVEVGENGEIRQLKAEGQNLSQIAVDLSISVATVNGDLRTDIPKYSVPEAAGDPAARQQTIHSSISVFA